VHLNAITSFTLRCNSQRIKANSSKTSYKTGGLHSSPVTHLRSPWLTISLLQMPFSGSVSGTSEPIPCCVFYCSANKKRDTAAARSVSGLLRRKLRDTVAFVADFLLYEMLELPVVYTMHVKTMRTRRFYIPSQCCFSTRIYSAPVLRATCFAVRS